MREARGRTPGAISKALIVVIAVLVVLGLISPEVYAGPNEDLLESAWKHDFEAARSALNRGADVNTSDDSGWTVLMHTAIKGNKNIASFLIEKGAEVNAISKSGFTALIFAAYQGHVDVARLLIEKGAHVNTKSNEECTALMFAALHGHGDVTRLLIEKGADVNARDSVGITALMAAEREGHTDVVRMLKEATRSPVGGNTIISDPHFPGDLVYVNRISEKPDSIIHTATFFKNGIFLLLKTGATYDKTATMTQQGTYVISGNAARVTWLDGTTDIFHIRKGGEIVVWDMGGGETMTFNLYK